MMHACSKETETFFMQGTAAVGVAQDNVNSTASNATH
jgi:hypothetical protein